MRATLAYTSARILLFIVAAVVLYLIGARGLVLLALALLASGIASFLVLSRARDRMSASLSNRLTARQEKQTGPPAKTTGLRAKFKEFGARLDEGATVEDEDYPTAGDEDYPTAGDEDYPAAGDAELAPSKTGPAEGRD